MAKKSGRRKGALTDEPSFTPKQTELVGNERETPDYLSRVIAWPLDDEPVFIVYGRKTPHRYWAAIVEYDCRLPEPLTAAAVRVTAQAHADAIGYCLSAPDDLRLPGPLWRYATRQERRESVLLAYQVHARERAYRTGRILPPVTKDTDRIRRRQQERDRIAAAVRGELPIQQGSRLERIVAAHRLYESTRGLIDIREEVARREMPDDDEEELNEENT